MWLAEMVMFRSVGSKLSEDPVQISNLFSGRRGFFRADHCRRGECYSF